MIVGGYASKGMEDNAIDEKMKMRHFTKNLEGTGLSIEQMKFLHNTGNPEELEKLVAAVEAGKRVNQFDFTKPSFRVKCASSVGDRLNRIRKPSDRKYLSIDGDYFKINPETEEGKKAIKDLWCNEDAFVNKELCPRNTHMWETPYVFVRDYDGKIEKVKMNVYKHEHEDLYLIRNPVDINRSHPTKLGVLEEKHVDANADGKKFTFWWGPQDLTTEERARIRAKLTAMPEGEYKIDGRTYRIKRDNEYYPSFNTGSWVIVRRANQQPPYAQSLGYANPKLMSVWRYAKSYSCLTRMPRYESCPEEPLLCHWYAGKEVELLDGEVLVDEIVSHDIQITKIPARD